MFNDKDGLHLRLITNESQEVRWHELQLLEGADAGLPDLKRSDRLDRKRHGTIHSQT